MSPTYKQGIEQVVIHATKHQDGGVDEVVATALSGLLADDQHVLDAEVTAVSSRIFWKATTANDVSDLNRTVSLDWTALDVTALTSAAAKFAILVVQIDTDAYTSGRAYIQFRKNGDTPTINPIVEARKLTGDTAVGNLIIAVDAGQIMEYRIVITGTIQIDTYISVVGYIE